MKLVCALAVLAASAAPLGHGSDAPLSPLVELADVCKEGESPGPTQTVRLSMGPLTISETTDEKGCVPDMLNMSSLKEFPPLFYSNMSKGQLIYAFASHEDVEDICPGDYFTPLFASEPLWAKGARTAFYLFLLMWCFLGIAIISDHFMASIEVITSKERVIVIQNEKGEAEERRVLIWDETVANLTLMALGSSAPEILLSVVETIGSLNKSDEELKQEEGLGPSTIVGSAAFNLLCITAVCVAAIKDGEKREIEGYGVFMITSAFSVFAYLWMLIALSDEKVTSVEAWVTFLMFPLLVFCSYAQNNSWFGKCGSSSGKVRPEGHLIAIEGENHKHIGKRRDSSARSLTLDQDKEQLAALLQKLPQDLTEADMARLAAQGFSQNKPSTMRYRIDARRKLAGGRGIIQRNLNVLKNHTVRRLSQLSSRLPEPASPKNAAPESAPHPNVTMGLPRVSFSAHAYSVSENAGFIKIPVVRTGDEAELALVSTVYFETRSGSARGSEDFVHTEGKLVFQPGETEKVIKVEIIDDNVFEPDETFTVVLSVKGNEHNADLENANCTACDVTIVDDDHPGTFTFTHGCLVVKESDGIVKCIIRRVNGADGKVKLSYRTKDFTAKKDVDYFHTEGTLVFEHGVNEAIFEVVLIDDKKYEKESTFAVEFEIIGHPDCGAEYGDHKILSITITSDDNYRATVDRVADLVRAHLESADIGTGSWSEQLKEALTVQGEDGEDPALLDCFLHVLSFPWKVVFVLVPPTSYCSGYLSFFVSLLFIGLLTSFVGDVAKTFGCLIGIPNGLTALTFVALGTSLPDTFASKTAAENDSNADNSIGNITGSNSVNVFLGLGLPWVIATLYRQVKTGQDAYPVPAGNSLETSVGAFCGIAAVYFSLMIFRRLKGWGELGGPKVPKYITVAVLLAMWVFYVGFVFVKVVMK